MLGRKLQSRNSFFKKVYNESPRFFSKVADVASKVAKGTGALAIIAPEFAPVLGSIGSTAEAISIGSKAIKGFLEKARNPHNRLLGKM